MNVKSIYEMTKNRPIIQFKNLPKFLSHSTQTHLVPILSLIGFRMFCHPIVMNYSDKGMTRKSVKFFDHGRSSPCRGKSEDLSAWARQVNYFARIEKPSTEHRKQVKIRARQIAHSDWLKLKWFNLDKNLSKRNC